MFNNGWMYFSKELIRFSFDNLWTCDNFMNLSSTAKS